LADLQRIAAENSPALRQAAAAVEAAKGALIQARVYPNPTIALQQTPNNSNTAAAFDGVTFDQVIKTGGKLKLAAAAAQKDLDNAELALKRARSDLATAVRTAYFGVLVTKETVRVNKALARFTDEIYRLQADLTPAGFAAPYEPATLRGQAYIIRLAYQQSLTNYAYAWKQLVAAAGLQQLPLSEVAGRVDRLIPRYDYDLFLSQVLARHSDVLTARNGVDRARYSLKLAQVIPVPDVEFNVGLWKEMSLPSFAMLSTASVSIPIPLWDQNKGNIISAQANLVQALEQPHRVEVTLTGGVATAFAAYKTNLDALEYYRRYILPDQVRGYRGVFERRQIDPNAAFADLVTAQQLLTTGVQTYLTTLGSLWTSVVTLADFLQTDDLFQTGQTLELPPLPDLECAPSWPCPHGTALTAAEACPAPAPSSVPTLPPSPPAELPAPRTVPAPLPVGPSVPRPLPVGARE
jgi:cobalt-zinc-cadmium efflux system outer membrane protein